MPATPGAVRSSNRVASIDRSRVLPTVHLFYKSDCQRRTSAPHPCSLHRDVVRLVNSRSLENEEAKRD